MQQFKVDVLGERNCQKVRKMRALLRKWKFMDGVEVSIGGYMDEFSQIIAGKPHPDYDEGRSYPVFTPPWRQLSP